MDDQSKEELDSDLRKAWTDEGLDRIAVFMLDNSLLLPATRLKKSHWPGCWTRHAECALIKGANVALGTDDTP